MKSPEMGFDPEQLNKEGEESIIYQHYGAEAEPESKAGGAPEQLMATKEVIEAVKFREQATEIEKGILERSIGKAKKAAGVLMLVSALSFTPGVVKEAYAGQEKSGTKVESVEKEKTQEEKTVDFLGKIYNLPDNPRTINPMQNELMKERAARVLIQHYALERKELTSGHVSPDDVRNTLKELNNVTGLFADKFFGNNDGKIDIEEIQKLNESIKSNAGMRALMEMFQQYSK